MFLRVSVTAAFVWLVLSGCASKPQEKSLLSPKNIDQSVTGSTTQSSEHEQKPFSTKTAFAAAGNERAQLASPTNEPLVKSPYRWMHPFGPSDHSGLAGRTLYVSSTHNIALANKEVVLSFDDGPVPGKTEKILSTLNDFGVKATFLMVGSMAQTYPAIAKRVVAEGHSVGSHTFKHPNLRQMSLAQAMAEIHRGEAAVRKATNSDVGFFRFPYLADSRSLRDAIQKQNMVIMDVQIDSKDYFKDSPEKVTARTMSALRARGSGIILFHDIHNRTANMLPVLLASLKSEGYSVVHLVYKPTVSGSDLIASLN
jgi:peptidoglycan/xylan/chitin deacetylase (PgdA/CDA1 family)